MKRGTTSTAITALVLVGIIVLNVIATALTDRFPSLNIDLTSSGLNSITEETEEIAVDVDKETYIYVIGDESDIKSDSYYSSYGIQYSQLAYIVEKLEETNGLITVEYIDPDLNPTFMSEYADEELTLGDVVVVTERRYKVLTVNDFFQYTTDDYGNTYLYSSVEGSLANALYVTNLDEVPVVAFATGHSEEMTDDMMTYVETLFTASAIDVVYFDILTEDIPEETDVLFLPTPTTDYSDSEIEKIEAYLDDTSNNYRSLFVTSSSGTTELTNFDNLLAEWGISVSNGVLYETDSTHLVSSETRMFLADINTEYTDFFDDETEYSLFVNAYTSPIELLFSNNDSIITYPLLYTSGSTYEVTGEDDDYSTETYITAALAQRTNIDGGSYSFTNVVVIGDTYSMDSSFILNSTFDNGSLYVDLINYICGTDDNSIGISISSVQTASYDVYATYSVIKNVTFLGFTIIIPVAIFGIGLVIFFRRRYL